MRPAMDLKTSIRRMLTRTRSQHKQQKEFTHTPPSAETVATTSADPCHTKPPTPPSSTPRRTRSETTPDRVGGAVQKESVDTPVNQITDQSRQSSTDDSRPASTDDTCDSGDRPVLVVQQATPTSEDGSSLQSLDAVNDTAVVR